MCLSYYSCFSDHHARSGGLERPQFRILRRGGEARVVPPLHLLLDHAVHRSHGADSRGAHGRQVLFHQRRGDGE